MLEWGYVTPSLWHQGEALRETGIEGVAHAWVRLCHPFSLTSERSATRNRYGRCCACVSEILSPLLSDIREKCYEKQVKAVLRLREWDIVTPSLWHQGEALRETGKGSVALAWVRYCHPFSLTSGRSATRNRYRRCCACKSEVMSPLLFDLEHCLISVQGEYAECVCM